MGDQQAPVLGKYYTIFCRDDKIATSRRQWGFIQQYSDINS